MNSGRFTSRAKEAIRISQESAVELGHNYVGTEHLLIGLIKVSDGVAARALQNQNISDSDILDKMSEFINETGGGTAELPRDFTPRTKKILEMSLIEAQNMGTGYIGTEHLLLALIREQEGLAVKILEGLNVNIQKLYEDILSMLGENGQGAAPMGKGLNKAKKSATPVLDQFSRDLTQYASEQKFDPIVGREKEIERVVQILSRRTKNNPCLVGDPGVGKTAIAEGLAQKIVSADIPETLKDKRVVSLDLSAMVAGSKYRGEFEDRIKKVMNEVKTANNVILFIDELHTIIGAGAAEGAIDASNILKPALSRGEIQVIGATTLNEYRKYVEKDAALERRFQPVKVEEPSEEEAIEMLIGLKDKYEAHHNVKISNSAINAAVKLSARYITDRFLPDKAIDLIDEAASKVRLKTYTMPPDIKKLEENLKDIEKEKEAAIKTEEYEKAGVLKQKQQELSKALEEEKSKWIDNNKNISQVVDEDIIADIVGLWTGIPVRKLQEEESQRLLKMEEILHNKIIGQNEAVTSISKAIRRGRVGLKNPKRPIGTFLFLGPTGVGKTELSRVLAEVLFGKDDSIIRVDMSEYMEKHSVSKLVGSPPGYVGYDEGGQLSEKVRKRPYSVILFDEIEKAHPDVFNILLQVLDDGHVTDSQGRKIDFKNTVIIMTSNAGARNIISPKKLGFVSDDNAKRNYEEMKKSVMDEIKNIFRPEFLNRIDDIIVFHPLEKDHIMKIAKIMVDEIIERVKINMGIEFSVSNAAISQIVEEGYDNLYGARPLRRSIQTKIEDLFASEVLEGKISEGQTAVADFVDGKFILKV